MNVSKKKFTRVFVQVMLGQDYWVDVTAAGRLSYESKAEAIRLMPGIQAAYGKDSEYRFVARTTVVTDKLL